MTFFECVQLMCAREPGLNQYHLIGPGVKPGMLDLRRMVYNAPLHNFCDHICCIYFSSPEVLLYVFKNYFKFY